MRKIITMIILMTLFFQVGVLRAEDPYVQLPKSEADRQTLLNNITDSFATFGKSGKEKQRILIERKAIRREERLRKARRRHDAKAQKQIKGQEKEVMRKVDAVNRSRYQKKK